MIDDDVGSRSWLINVDDKVLFSRNCVLDVFCNILYDECFPTLKLFMRLSVVISRHHAGVNIALDIYMR